MAESTTASTISSINGETRSPILKALTILEAVVSGDRAVSLHELTESLGIPKPTAHRVALLLEREGFLGREPGNKRFVPGHRLVDLSFGALRAAARQGPSHLALMRLAEDIGEDCGLAVLMGGEVARLDIASTAHPLGVVTTPDGRSPIHCTATGKIFLAYMPPSRRERILAAVPLKRFTPSTIIDPLVIARESALIRERGYATDDGECQAGVTCIAVPVRSLGGEVRASVCVVAPEARMSVRDALRHLPALRETAARISDLLAPPPRGSAAIRAAE